MIILLNFCSCLVLAQDAVFTGYATSRMDLKTAEIKTYGLKDKSKKIPYDSLTIQPVGSVSKVIIGLAVMKACEMGLVSLDADINEYLPFKVFNPNLKNSQTITLRHLATHTSGVKDNEKFYMQAYTKGVKSRISLEEFLISYFDQKGVRFSAKNFGNYAAGEEYNYSNIGAALAAYVVERASKVPFHQFTESHLFQPLNMRHTHWFFDEALGQKYTQLFDEQDNPLESYSLATYPDGAMKTNIVDLTKLLQALMSGYKGTSTLLRESSWKIFYSKNFAENKSIKGLNPKEPNCGIFIVYAKSGAIGHTGSDPGLCSFMFFNPERMTGRIFMGNEDLTPQNIDSFKSIWDNLETKND